MTWTVDAVDQGVARVEDEEGRFFELPAALLPPDAREGTVVSVETLGLGDRSVVFLRLDEAATATRLRAVEDRLERLRARDPGGDVEL